jgi:hypothetical protein
LLKFEENGIKNSLSGLLSESKKEAIAFRIVPEMLYMFDDDNELLLLPCVRNLDGVSNFSNPVEKEEELLQWQTS